MYLQKKAELDFDELREWCEQNMLQQKRLDEVWQIPVKIDASKNVIYNKSMLDEGGQIGQEDREASGRTWPSFIMV